jgi:hypothetical protein
VPFPFFIQSSLQTRLSTFVRQHQFNLKSNLICLKTSNLARIGLTFNAIFHSPCCITRPANHSEFRCCIDEVLIRISSFRTTVVIRITVGFLQDSRITGIMDLSNIEEHLCASCNKSSESKSNLASTAYWVNIDERCRHRFCDKCYQKEFSIKRQVHPFLSVIYDQKEDTNHVASSCFNSSPVRVAST